MQNKKRSKTKRIILNSVSVFTFVFSLVIIAAVSKRMIENYRLNEALKEEKDYITEEIKLLEDERNNGQYYDIYIKDNFTVYDGEVIIEFNK